MLETTKYKEAYEFILVKATTFTFARFWNFFTSSFRKEMKFIPLKGRIEKKENETHCYKSVSLPALARSAERRCSVTGGALPRLATAVEAAASTRGLRAGCSSRTLGRRPTAMLSRGPSEGSKYLPHAHCDVCTYV